MTKALAGMFDAGLGKGPYGTATPFGVEGDLRLLAGGPNGMGPLEILVVPTHPSPAETTSDVAPNIPVWRRKVEEGVIHNGYSLAPTEASFGPDGGLCMKAFLDDYVHNRASVDAWKALPQAERSRILMEEGFDVEHSRFLGTAISVISTDGRLLLGQRSMRTITEPGLWACAVGEGVDENDVKDGRVDIPGCMARGFKEELGLDLPQDVLDRCLTVQAVTNHAKIGEIVFTGLLDLRSAPETGLTASKIVESATSGAARDSWEHARWRDIPATAQALLEFSRKHEGMSSYGLFCSALAISKGQPQALADAWQEKDYVARSLGAAVRSTPPLKSTARPRNEDRI